MKLFILFITISLGSHTPLPIATYDDAGDCLVAGTEIVQGFKKYVPETEDRKITFVCK